MQVDREQVLLLEDLCVKAWPALEQVPLDAWTMRATYGITKRANSVYAIGPFPHNMDWMRRIEEFYHSRKIPASYYVSDSSPEELDGILESQGYEKVFECFIMTADATEVSSRIEKDNRFTFVFAEEADEQWIRDFIQLEDFPSVRIPAYQHIFSAIEAAKSFVRICEKGETIGLGTVVVDQGWAILSNIIVSPTHRRKGVGLQLVCALTDWAAEKGATNLALQVIQNNTAAVNLYRQIGFSPVSKHHYRVLTAN
ncbi:GNAT family N-acetyltransferase [Brevibacillus sp. SYSU BS000544]|uniref:GNAT family N-acetyltransferase n=1 Tax=Brevibacillus sp. SYSU BS000544 TaxID=3416443 RepID=UPI003CE488CB